MTLKKKKIVYKSSCPPWTMTAEKASPRASHGHQGCEAPGMRKQRWAVQTPSKSRSFLDQPSSRGSASSAQVLECLGQVDCNLLSGLGAWRLLSSHKYVWSLSRHIYMTERTPYRAIKNDNVKEVVIMWNSHSILLTEKKKSLPNCAMARTHTHIT